MLFLNRHQNGELMKCSWLHRDLLVGLFLLAVLSPFSWAEGEGVWQPKKDFSADLVEYNKHHPELHKKIFIQIGQGGMRMTSFDRHSGKPSFMTIQNFRSHQQWLVRPQRLYYSELPQEGFGTEKTNKELNFSKGVLNPEPCLGMKKEKNRVYDFGGGELTVWSCSSNNGSEFVQHYSKLLGIVVRQEEGDGHIFEIRNIILMPSKKEVFRPSSLWREVTLESFFTGASVLPDYQE